MTIDVWMQHPTVRFLGHEMLASLRRWTGGAMPQKDSDVPIEATVASMDAAGVDFGLLSAWRGPNGLDLVSNDEVVDVGRPVSQQVCRSGDRGPRQPDGGRSRTAPAGSR